jgi:ABC-2 type transport system permease protein
VVGEMPDRRPLHESSASPPPTGGHASAHDHAVVVEWSKRRGPIDRIVDVWRYRELLRNLVRKELKVKYKNSALGFVWTLLNPTLYLLVFTVVFQYLLPNGVPDFAIFFLSGLLVWNLFSGAVGGACSSIVSNAALVQKVWFPREILPLSAIGAALMHFCFQAVVLLAALVTLGRAPDWKLLPLTIVALVALLLFATALGLVLAALNVYYRDVQHLLELALLAWFWFSAVVYPFRTVADRLGDKSSLALLNPVIPPIITFQKAIYNPTDDTVPTFGAGWYLMILGITAAASAVLLIGALVVFSHLEDNFAEEI